MTSERRLRLLSRLVGDAAELDTERLGQVSAEVTGSDGAGIMLMSGDLPQGTLTSTNPVSATIEELQFTLGQGPCVDAYRQDRPVAEPDLADPELFRWPAFSPSAVEAGVRAVFAFPLHLGQVRLGALDLYRDHPGGLNDDEHGDALAMADIATRAVLAIQADAAPGQLAVELEAGADFHFVIHQASGMVAAQLGVDRGHGPDPPTGLRLQPRPHLATGGRRRGRPHPAVRPGSCPMTPARSDGQPSVRAAPHTVLHNCWGQTRRIRHQPTTREAPC